MDNIFEFKSGEDVIDKDLAIKVAIMYDLDRTLQMFKYTGSFPDTLPPERLEYYLQANGNCFVTDVNGNLYAFTGGLGGEPNEYYLPTIYTVANPALGISKNYVIGEDGILVKSDPLLLGLIPLIRLYESMKVENRITMRNITILDRKSELISASDDRTKASAELYLSKLEKGSLGIIADSPLIDSLKVHPTGDTGGNKLIQHIEFEQYLDATLWNKLGLQSNYNMKRENITANEADLNSDTLHPFVDSMLNCRKQALDEINLKYGTDFSVEFSSSWKQEITEGKE